VQALTQPLYLDVNLPPGQKFIEPVEHTHNAFIYGIEGETVLSDIAGQAHSIKKDQLAVLSKGNEIALTAGPLGSRFLFVSGKPLNEPVARGGPFVMNFNSEIVQAIADYQAGNF